MKRRLPLATSTLLLLTLTSQILRPGLVHAYPGDVFQNDAPAVPMDSTVLDRARSKTKGHSVGDTGAVTFTVPFEVPPNRQDMVPEVALSYSSQLPLRGGVAAGWSMDIPLIEVDTSQGTMKGTNYRSSLSAGRLIKVKALENLVVPGFQTTQEYRAAEDDRYVKYERVFDETGTVLWRAYTTDGRIYELGGTPESRDTPNGNTAAGVTEGRFFVTKITDRFGNEVQYNYTKVWAPAPGVTGILQQMEIVLQSIEYGKNANAGLAHHSRVSFDYHALNHQGFDKCAGSNVPIGAQFDFRSGFLLYKGAARLDKIRAQVLQGAQWVDRRSLTLGYDASELACNVTGTAHAPLRLLTSVQEAAVAPDGTVTTQPAQSFTYGRRERTFNTPMPGASYSDSPAFGLQSLGTGQNPLSFGKAGGWPTVDYMLMDLDGDGRLDQLGAVSQDLPSLDPYFCQATWQKGTQSGYAPASLFGATLSNPANAGAAVPGVLPVMRWAGAYREDTGATFDNREGCSLSAQFSRYANISWDNDHANGFPADYLSYRYMDVDGDGLPDLVTAVDTNRGRYHPEDDPYLLPQPAACQDQGACRSPGGQPEICKVLSPTTGPLFFAPGSGTGASMACPQGGCWIPGCSADSTTCCSPVGCNSGDHPSVPSGDPAAIDASSEAFSDWGPAQSDWEGGRDWTSSTYETGPVGREGVPGRNGSEITRHWPEIECGRYVLRMYKNLGNGSFGPPQVVMSPIPLETERPTSRLGVGHLAVSSSWHGFLDVDGDGLTDAIHMDPYFWGTSDDYDDSPDHFSVFLGDGTGNYVGSPAGGGYPFHAPRRPAGVLNSGAYMLARSRVRLSESFGPSSGPPGSPTLSWNYEAVTLEDLNGDGLPDYVDNQYWHDAPSEGIRVFFNTGRGFHTGLSGANGSGTVLNPGQPNAKYFSRSVDWGANRYEDNARMRRGYARSTHRLVDVDMDGLTDLVVLPAVTGSDNNPWLDPANAGVRLYLNVGDRLVDAGTNAMLQSIWPALARITLSHDGRWTVMSDMVDVDGDGLPEAITNEELKSQCYYGMGSGGTWSGLCGVELDGRMDAPSSGPMRLLTGVSNGRGGSVSFSYAPLRPTTGRLPHPQWVVSSAVVNAGTDANGGQIPLSTTTYAYDAPAFNKDFHGDYGFRGFGKTTITSPSGSSTITTRDFSAYYGGRVMDVRVKEAGGHVASIERSTWEQRLLFNTDPLPDQVRTQHVVTKTLRTCGAAQTEAQCDTSGALTTTENFWVPLVTATDSTPLGHDLYMVRSGSGFGGLAGNKYDAHWDEFRASGSQYWLYRKSEWSGRYSGYWVAENDAQTSHYFSAPDSKVELWTSRYVSAADGWAVTSHVYDMLTGNKTIERSPNHFGMQVGVVYAYDATQRFVTQTTNELGHTSVKVTDPATGVVLEERGANQKNGVREGKIWTIDGFGRVLTESVMVDDPALGYKPLQIEANTYSDLPRPKVISYRRVDGDMTLWARVDHESDGLGRPLSTSTWDGAAVVARTSLFRDAAGNVVRERSPKPNGSLATETVDWTFAFDSLGRPLGTAEPTRSGCTEISNPTGYCGTKVTYDGRVTTTEEVAGTLSGDAAGTLGKTRNTVDPFDRLIQVEALTSAGGWAVTTYGYDGSDNVISITNADNVVTTLTYDQLNRKRTLTRGGKTWRFDYDPNGNVTKIVAPMPAGAVEADYTTAITYDWLDRETGRTVGKRDLTPAEVNVLGTGTETRTYDQNPNGLGRLTSEVWSHGTTTYAYDARGLVTDTTQSFSLMGGAFSDTRTEHTDYGANGAVIGKKTGDGATPSQASVFTLAYDGRGLPSALVKQGSPPTTLIQLARNPAGRVITRSRPGATAPVAQSTAVFDDVGRVTQLTVQSRLPGQSTLSTRASEAFFFSASGEAYRMDSRLAATGQSPVHTAFFGYDRQHQLLTATGPAGYTGAFAYSPGGRIQSANVAASASAPRVHDRNVTYTYGTAPNADPDAPVELTSAGGGAWMSITYDTAGNADTRTVNGVLYEHAYDGADRQRAVVTSPDGTYDLYWYDGRGARNLVMTTGPSGVVTRVKWTFGNTEIWYDGDGDVERSFAAASLDGHDVRVADGTDVEHHFNDARGHLIAAVGDDGALQGGFRYGPYGELLEEVGTQSGDLLRRFNGKERDDTTGLSYYGYRYFDERTLTWTQADPLYRFLPERAGVQPRRGNLYAFSLGNPISLVDPDGRDARPGPPVPPCKGNPDAKVCKDSEGRVKKRQAPPPAQSKDDSDKGAAPQRVPGKYHDLKEEQPDGLLDFDVPDLADKLKPEGCSTPDCHEQIEKALKDDEQAYQDSLKNAPQRLKVHKRPKGQGTKHRGGAAPGQGGSSPPRTRSAPPRGPSTGHGGTKPGAGRAPVPPPTRPVVPG